MNLCTKTWNSYKFFFNLLLKNGGFWSPACVYKVSDWRLHLAGDHLKIVLCLLATHWNLCRSSKVKVVLICVLPAEISCTHCSAEPRLLSFQSHKGQDDLTIKTATHVTSLRIRLCTHHIFFSRRTPPNFAALLLFIWLLLEQKLSNQGLQGKMSHFLLPVTFLK